MSELFTRIGITSLDSVDREMNEISVFFSRMIENMKMGSVVTKTILRIRKSRNEEWYNRYFVPI